MKDNQPTPAEPPGPLQRTELVTLVFTDIVGSTALKQQLGDKAGAVLIQVHAYCQMRNHPAATKPGSGDARGESGCGHGLALERLQHSLESSAPALWARVQRTLQGAAGRGQRARVGLATSKNANSNLHLWLKANPKPGGEATVRMMEGKADQA